MNKLGRYLVVGDVMGGYAKVRKTSRNGGEYDVVITVPFVTKDVAQSNCDKFVKHGLHYPPLRAG